MEKKNTERRIQSVQRAVDIINCFDNLHTELSLGQISTQLGLNKSTVHGILNTLYLNDFIRQAPSGRYTLGGYFVRRLRMGDNSVRAVLKDVALDGMTNIANKYGVSCGLFMLELGELVLVNRIQPQNETYTITTHATYIQPLYCSASGKILLAHMGKSALNAYLQANPLIPRTPKTITSQNELLQALDAVRKEGYGLEDEELGLGVYALSVPIYDGSNQLFATVGASGLEFQLRKQREDVVSDLKNLSRNITQSIF